MPDAPISTGDETRMLRVSRDLLDHLSLVPMPPYVGKSNEDRAEYAISKFLESGSEAGDMGVKPELSRVGNNRRSTATK